MARLFVIEADYGAGLGKEVRMLGWLIGRPFAIASCCSFLILFGLFSYLQFGLFHIRVSAYAGKTFDGTGFYKPSDAREILKGLTEEDRKSYLTAEVTEDLIFPIVYSLMFAVAIAGLAPVARVPRWLVLIPFATAFFDYIENTCVVAMLLIYKSNPDASLSPFSDAGSVASAIKTTLFILSAFGTLIIGLIWVVRK
jgi:hypothetical protein